MYRDFAAWGVRGLLSTDQSDLVQVAAIVTVFVVAIILVNLKVKVKVISRRRSVRL